MLSGTTSDAMWVGRMNVKICPDCGQHNSVHAQWCLGCERMLSVKAIVVSEAEVPESSDDCKPRSDRVEASGEKGPVGQSSEPTADATLRSNNMQRPVDPRLPSRSIGNPAAPGVDPGDGSYPEGILIPEDSRRAGCLSLWLVGVMVFNALGIILMLLEGRFDLIACGFCLVNITFAAALWHLKRWGAYGLAGSFSLSFVLGLAIQDLYIIAGSIIPLILLYALVKPRWGVLE